VTSPKLTGSNGHILDSGEFPIFDPIFKYDFNYINFYIISLFTAISLYILLLKRNMPTNQAYVVPLQKIWLFYKISENYHKSEIYVP